MRAPRVPASDGEVVETCPPSPAGRAKSGACAARWRRARATKPRRSQLARRYIELRAIEGDPRYAGYAMGALRPGTASRGAHADRRAGACAPPSRSSCTNSTAPRPTSKSALARQPGNAQAWLTLATILRVRGRYGESDAACRALGRVGPALYGVACLAENAGLRGDQRRRATPCSGLLAAPALQGAQQAGTRQWLLTSAGRDRGTRRPPAPAEAAYRQALAARALDGYLLLRLQRLPAARRTAPPRSALLAKSRAAMRCCCALAHRGAACRPARRQRAEPTPTNCGARFDAAALRPGNAASTRARRRCSRSTSQDDRGARSRWRALNVQAAAEPVDLLLLARAAAAAERRRRPSRGAALLQQIGLRDARVDAASADRRLARDERAWLRCCCCLLLALLAAPRRRTRTRPATPTCSCAQRRRACDVRWDIALRDLDAVLDLDRDGDRKLTWGEVRARMDDIRAYALARLRAAAGPLRADRGRSHRPSTIASTAPTSCCSLRARCHVGDRAVDRLPAVPRGRPHAPRPAAHRHAAAGSAAGAFARPFGGPVALTWPSASPDARAGACRRCAPSPDAASSATASITS